MNFYPRMVIVIAPFVLAACAATDLKSASGISESDRRIAQTIAERTAANCIKRRTMDSPTNTPISGDVKLSTVGEVRRLYSSSRGWYKAEVVSEGIWDNVYYNTLNKALVCGEKTWQQYSDSGELKFVEVGSSQKRLP